MISYLKGPIAYKSETEIIVEAGGVGYVVRISLNTYNEIREFDAIKIHTHLQVKEDSHTLFGFFSVGERKMFRYLISVSGIGGNTAMVILSGLKTEDVQQAIIENRVDLFKKVKGIGPKTAQRIILDLKDKLVKDGIVSNGGISSFEENPIREEAISALMALGFNKSQVQRMTNLVLRDDSSIQNVEELIKKTLQKLS